MSTFELWNVITGCSSLQDPESIGKELERFLPMLKVGLCFYKESNAESDTKVKSSTTIKRKEFLIKLSKVLNLDGLLTQELFQNYLRLDFRGSGPQLNNILKHDAQLEGFHLKLLKFYFKERLYLLKNIKYLITYWQDDTCFYREEFAKVVDQLASQDLIGKLLKQLKELLKKPANHSGVKGNYVAETEFANEYMKEMCELVDIIFLYYKDFDMSVEVFQDLANLFKLHHFGYSHVNRKMLSVHAAPDMERFGYISSLVLLEGLDMELTRKAILDKDNFKDHPLLKNDTWKKIDSLLYTWDDVPQQGPVLMAWTIFRHVYLPPDEQQLTRIFGEAALKCQVYEYFQRMLENPLYNEVNSGISGLVKSFIYLTLSSSLKIFDEGSLCDYQILITLASKVLLEPIITSLFLSEDQAGGTSLLLKSSKKLFPFMATPYLRLMRSICCDAESADIIFESFDKQDTFTEMFSRNTVDEIEVLNEKYWQRKRNRRILSHSKDELILHAGTRGSTFQYKQETRVVEWEYPFSGWRYCLLELSQIIATPYTYANDSGEEGLLLAEHYIQLVNTILSTRPEKIQELEPVISAIVVLFKRLMQAQSKPLELISSCMECLLLVMEQQPIEIWENLSEAQFLPYQRSHARSVVPTMWPGLYGETIFRTELQISTYKVTKVYLTLISQMLNGPLDHVAKDISDPTNKKIYLDIAANLVFIIKEVFASFGTWKFSIPEDKEVIALHCLQIFHKVLSPNFQEVSAVLKDERIPSLKEAVREGLSYHRAGDSLLAILAVGVDGLENSIDNNSSQKSNAIQVVKLSLSVFNLLLTKSQNSATLTRLEELVSQQFVQQSSDVDFVQPVCKVSLLSVIAKYIFHRHDPKLTILAVIALKTLSVRFPLILTACFGDALVGIRNAFVNKLNGRVEAVRLKVAILELLSASVESQPGIIESFTHIQTDKSKKFTFGKFSCLPAVMEILENKKVVDVLTSAALEFVAALWYNRYDSAMMLLRKNKIFWESITRYVNVLDTTPVQPVTYEVIRHALDIITVESYYVKSNEFDDTLEARLKSICNEQLYERIGKLFSVNLDEKDIKKKLALINSFHNYASIMFSTQENYGNLKDEKIAATILNCTVEALRSWTNVLGDKTLEMTSTIIQHLSKLLWTLVRNYRRTSVDYDNVLETLCQILQDLPKCDKETFYNTAQPLCSVLLFILQNRGNKVVKGSWVCGLFALICDRLQFHKDDGCCVHHHHMKVNKISICLLNELTNYIPSHSVQSIVMGLQSCGILRNLMHDVSSYLQRDIHMGYIENVLEFFLNISQKELFAEHVYNSGFGKFVCLELHEVYRLQSENTQKIWCIILAITSHLLRKLRHTFLQTAVDFIGTYEEVLMNHMNVTEALSSPYGLQITEQLAMFCSELSKYRLDIEFMLPQVFQKMKLGVGQMSRLSIALLSRQKLIKHAIESQHGDNEKLMNLSKSPSPVSLRSDSILSGHSCSDRNEKMSVDVEIAFTRLISILCYSLASLRHFTPNVVETILDEGMDIQSFSPLVDLKFNPPSLDLNDTPSFGSLIACINVSIKMIHKAAQSESERATPEKDTFLSLGSEPEKRRASLWFVIENALVVILSQASCFLRHPHIDDGAKQFLKRELGSELTNFMYAVYRFKNRRGVPPSPESSTSSASLSVSTTFWRSPSKLSTMMSINEEEESSLLKLIDNYTKHLLR